MSQVVEKAPHIGWNVHWKYGQINDDLQKVDQLPSLSQWKASITSQDLRQIQIEAEDKVRY